MTEPSTWVEIAPSALRDNLAAAARHAGVPVCAVVKANGYGHGIVTAARAFVGAGAAMLAVTRLEEARALRDGGIEAPVLIMSPVPDAREAVKIGCAITVGSSDEILTIPAEAQVHLKIDTGMGRLGVRPEEASAAAIAVGERATLEGVWTHFASATSSREQLDRFIPVVSALRSQGLAFIAHAANSAALVTQPDARFDMVRPGTVLYGMDPPGVRVPWTVRSAFTWYARVTAARSLPAGATVGYGREWRARRPTRVATLPIGYADGFGLEPAARTESLRQTARVAARAVAIRFGLRPSPRAVFFGDRRAAVVGRIAMQTTTVTLDGIPDVHAGSVARIPARRLLVHPAIERIEVDA